MQSQHIMLKSGACHELFPDNTNASFKNKLGKRLNTIDGDWEVALLGLRYPQNWDNVREGRLSLHYVHQASATNPLLEDMLHDMRHTRIELRVANGRYRSIDGLIKAINESISTSEFSDLIEFKHDAAASRVSIQFTSRVRVVGEGLICPTLTMSRDLSRILGYKDGEELAPEFTEPDSISYRSHRPPDPDAGLYSILIYCSLVSERVVGDADVSVLRSTPVRGGESLQTHEEYLTPHYLPAVSVDTDIVEVHIRDEEGALIPFEGGTVDLSLFLRRVGSGRTA